MGPLSCGVSPDGYISMSFELLINPRENPVAIRGEISINIVYPDNTMDSDYKYVEADRYLTPVFTCGIPHQPTKGGGISYMKSVYQVQYSDGIHKSQTITWYYS